MRTEKLPQDFYKFAWYLDRFQQLKKGLLYTVKFCSSPVLKPRGGLDVFTYRDQWSIFLGFEFRKSVFLGVLVRAVVFFGCCQTNAVFLSVLCFRK